MAFTARLALLAIRLMSVAALLSSCGKMRPPTEPKAFNADILKLRMENGLVYNGSSLFTGKIYALTPAGDSVFSKSYRDGAEDGRQKLWYPNRQLQEERWYKDGKKAGINRGYWPNGARRYEYQFVNDLYEGIQYEWYNSNKLFSKKNYKAGYESGLQQTWEENNKIRSNYEARNGRNYGNIGKKNCYSVFKNSSFRNTP